MSDVLILPLDLSPEASRRLRDRLERDLAAGSDPGPRHAQIACLSGSLARSLHQLREALGRALSEMPADDPSAHSLQEAASGMASLAQAVIDLAGVCRAPARAG
jgi:hypothetical protein